MQKKQKSKKVVQTLPTRKLSTTTTPNPATNAINLGERGYDKRRDAILNSRRQNAVNALNEMQGSIITFADAYAECEDDVKLAYNAMERIMLKIIK